MLQALKASLPGLNLFEAYIRAMHSKRIWDSPSQDDVPQIFRLNSFKSLALYEITIDNLQHFLSDGRLTSVEYVQFCLDRIHRVGMPFV